MNRTHLFSALALVAALAIAPNPASAEPAWAKDVPKATQDQANALYAQGNDLFLNKDYAQANEKYKAAVALWDHPLIRFNLVRTLINLDRPLEAAAELEGALRFGAEPFEADKYQAALEIQTLLKGRVGYIEAKCDQSGANVLLDGKPWFACPGTAKLRVMAGEHALVGEQKGYLTSAQRILVIGGSTVNETVKLIPLENAVILTYPYPRWIAWTAAGIGAAVAFGGLGFWLSGRSEMDQFESDFASQCASGCPKDLPDDDGKGNSYRLLREERDSAQLKGTIGITMMIAGGVIAIGGIVGVIVDRPKRTLPNVEVTPLRGGGGAATVGWQF